MDKLNGRLEEKKLTGGLKNYSTKQDKEKKLKKVRSIYNEKVPKHDQILQNQIKRMSKIIFKVIMANQFPELKKGMCS